MPKTEIKFAEIGTEYLDDALRLVGLNYPKDDWAMLLGLRLGYVAIMDGQVIGAMCMELFDEVATIALLIVDEKMRRRGLGARLMKLALEEAGARECRVIANDVGLPLYRKLGFKVIEPIYTHRGVVAPVQVPDDVEWATDDDFDQISEVDRRATGFDRRPLISALWSTGRFAVMRHSGKVMGYAALFQYRRKQVAGPVVARSSVEARCLLSMLFSNCAGAALSIDLRPESELADWLNSIGIAETFSSTAMRRGEPRVDVARSFHTYALPTLRFGFP
ncbi:GNAT family N-acetyltransferase [Mesorhizobium sp. B283B1A]|uniref:GNAT family N-acetyltransferase n=1 Tax=Mesorhizobium TaxID=68287 RepID=UPI001CD08930|nr:MULTISPECIES: GNAT family N-acetyltransferase [Mesorhizobium]MCA0051166.1 GNAT family N-acetyltransferase [Mesorhizobium sp. B283B1A]UQS64566.1 GNAT family N-acetyltransferase [Mesorhizobium opportunistum]